MREAEVNRDSEVAYQAARRLVAPLLDRALAADPEWAQLGEVLEALDELAETGETPDAKVEGAVHLLVGEPVLIADEEERDALLAVEACWDAARDDVDRQELTAGFGYLRLPQNRLERAIRIYRELRRREAEGQTFHIIVCREREPEQRRPGWLVELQIAEARAERTRSPYAHEHDDDKPPARDALGRLTVQFGAEEPTASAPPVKRGRRTWPDAEVRELIEQSDPDNSDAICEPRGPHKLTPARARTALLLHDRGIPLEQTGRVMGGRSKGMMSRLVALGRKLAAG